MAEPKLRVRASGFGGSGYRIPTRETEENPRIVVPGVTTVLKVIDKPALIQWAANQTAAYAVANLDALLSRTEEQGFGFLQYFHSRKPKEGDELRLAHKYVLDDAAELGTNIHDWIEAYMTNQELPELISEEAEEMAVEFVEWESKHDIEVLHTEATVYNSEHAYAGTLDGIWKIDGVPTLVDLKSSRNTWQEHRMQLSSLIHAEVMMIETDVWDEEATPYTNSKKETTYWKEIPMPKVEAAALIHMRPWDIDNSGNPIDAFCKYKPLDVEDWKAYYDGFVSARQMAYHMYEVMKPLEKKYK